MNETTAKTQLPRALSPEVPAAHNQALGALGETMAAEFLEQCEFQILDRNWRNRYGELDVIARHGRTLVAVEVKTRSGSGFGGPLEAITARKAARLRRLLLDWVRVHEGSWDELRVDAIGITLRPGEEPRIDHLVGIS